MSPDANEEPDAEDIDEDIAGDVFELRLQASGERLDKALAAALPTLSRARLQALIAQGALSRDGQTIASSSGKTQGGVYRLAVPAPVDAQPQPQALPLQILYEDAYLVVLDKPAGMAWAWGSASTGAGTARR